MTRPDEPGAMAGGSTLAAELRALALNGGPLTALDRIDLDGLAGEAEPVRCQAGELLMRSGDPADAVYIVLSGRLEALAPATSGEAQVLNEIRPGELVGEVALVVGGTRTADVRAVEPSRLAKLTRDRFDELLASSPATWRHVLELVLERLRRFELLPHLDRLLGPFDAGEGEVLRTLVDAAEFASLARGETLFSRGDAADAAYVVLSGTLRVVREREPGREQLLLELSRGELIGETALVTETERAATVYAVRDSSLARIPRPSFLALLGRRPHAALKIAGLVIERIRRAESVAARRDEAVTSLTLLPSASAVELEPVTSQLAAELARHGTVAVLTSEAVDAALGRPGISQASPADPASLRLTRWLDEQEQRHRFVLYRADRAWTPWSERCSRQTDHVVILADAATSPEPGNLERRLESDGDRRREPRRTLLLQHPSDLELPRGTAGWLAERQVDEIYHLRRGHEGDLARVGRLLAGRGVGVVFGGGGARGFAHLGVLRALEELGVPVDLIGGASIGAPVAVPSALGLDAAGSLELIRKGFHSLLDYTLPVVSLVSGRRISRSIHRHMAGIDIEDLWLPYFCVSTNLTTAESKVHRRGNLARAVRASVSIPGVLPPVPIDGELHVDGGLLNNVPIDVLRERNPHGTVIAIDVSPPRGPVARGDFGVSVSGWGLALGRLRFWRRGHQIPALAATLLHSQVVAANRARERMLDDGLADFYRNIHVRGVGILEFEKVDAVARLGYEDVLDPLREWLAADGVSSGSERLSPLAGGSPPA